MPGDKIPNNEIINVIAKPIWGKIGKTYYFAMAYKLIDFY